MKPKPQIEGMTEVVESLPRGLGQTANLANPFGLWCWSWFQNELAG